MVGDWQHFYDWLFAAIEIKVDACSNNGKIAFKSRINIDLNNYVL